MKVFTRLHPLPESSAVVKPIASLIESTQALAHKVDDTILEARVARDAMMTYLQVGYLMFCGRREKVIKVIRQQ
jgi:hypothetical protein